MEIVSIDIFIVPEESVKAFQEQSRKIQSFIKTLPGFIEGFSYEKQSGDSKYNFMTTAVWKNEEAFEKAGKAIWAEFQKQGFNPQELFVKLKIERIRSEYHRSAY